MEKAKAACESCAYYDCDGETGEYICEMNMDEDDLYRLAEGHYRECPFYRYYDEYAVVRKQN